jgi:hypothetical protein
VGDLLGYSCWEPVIVDWDPQLIHLHMVLRLKTLSRPCQAPH